VRPLVPLQPVLPPAVMTAGNLCGPEGSERRHDAPTLFRINASYFLAVLISPFSFSARGKYNCEN
jgi:hypothetical protein